MMGRLISPAKPRAAKKDWKPHSTLQICYEALVNAQKPLHLSRNGENFVLSDGDRTVEARDICTALVMIHDDPAD